MTLNLYIQHIFQNNLFFDILRRRKPVKILIHIQPDSYSLATTSLSKTSPSLSQMNIYDANLVDLFIEKFLEKIDFDYAERDYFKIRLPLVVDIFRKKQRSDFFLLNPTLSDILKRVSDRRPFFLLRRKYSISNPKFISILEFFKISMINYIFLDNNFPFYIFNNNFKFIRGVLCAIRVRREMKKRKINFRRKHGKYQR